LQVCKAIYDTFEGDAMRCPNTPEEWLSVSEAFERKWQFPHAVGALDGKHVRIRNPAKGGSQYYNYKGYFSIVMLALVDADYRFLWLQIGVPGSSSDAQIFNSCALRDAIVDGSINFPPAQPLATAIDKTPVPYFLIADDAFALQPWLQKPYSGRHLDREQRIFNYRLSRARRVVFKMPLAY
jgi:hypothetical protein